MAKSHKAGLDAHARVRLLTMITDKVRRGAVRKADTIARDYRELQRIARKYGRTITVCR